ncbi:MAG TPA: hypothetical protein VNQ77_05440 [Frankiaceae bacterium]|nr:hypothetical protein [Frankiaceae bacterium]
MTPPRLARWQHRRAGLVVLTAVVVAIGVLWLRPVMPEPYFAMQFAFTNARATTALAGWAAEPGLDASVAFLQRDYAFMALYWLPLVFGVGIAADRYRVRGTAMTWLPLVASLCDAVENAFTLRLVSDGRDGTIDGAFLAPAASTAALAKWMLIAAVVAYVVRSWFVRRG